MTHRKKRCTTKRNRITIQHGGQQYNSNQATQAKLPEQIHMFGRKDVLGVLIVFIVVFILYTITLSPTVTSGDSGELISAAYDLGVAHPPGYPLWTLIAHIFIKVLPFSSVAYRVNLMSAFFGAATSAVMFIVMRQLAIAFLPSIAAAVCLGFSKELWAQSVIAEVYSLNSFLVAILLMILFHWHKNKENKWILVLVFIFGLALTNHQSIALLGPVGLIFIVATKPQLVKDWKLIISILAVFSLGLSIYFYLPWAAQRNCYMNWGDPQTLKTFVEHVMRSQYPSDLTKIPRTPLNILGQFGASVKLLLDQFTPFLAVLLPSGIIVAWKSSKAKSVLLLMIFAVFEIACMFIINFRMTRQDLFSITVFYIPAYMICSVFIGFAFSEIDKITRGLTIRMPFGRIFKKYFTFMLCIPVLLTCLKNFSENNLSNCYYAYDHGKNILDTMDYGSVIFPSGDHNTFPLIYLIHVEKYRPDIIVADKYGYVESDLLKDTKSPPLDPAGHISKQWAENYIINDIGRKVYFTVKRSMTDLPEYHLEPCGLLYKVIKNSESTNLQNPWINYYYQNNLYEPQTTDYGNANIIADFHYMKGLFLLRNGQFDLALEEFAITKNIGHAIKELYNNIGSALAEQGLIDEAIDYYKRSLIYDIQYEGALWNLARIYKNKGDIKASIDYFERLRKADEQDFRVHGELGFLYLQTGNRNSAYASFNRSLKLFPDQPQVKEQLADMNRHDILPQNIQSQVPSLLIPQIPDPPLPFQNSIPIVE